MKWLLLVLFLISCSSNKYLSNTVPKKFNFSDEVSLEDFKLKLNYYVKESVYPDINE